MSRCPRLVLLSCSTECRRTVWVATDKGMNGADGVSGGPLDGI